MEERFIHIATLQFKHEYFEDGLFRPLKISPTATTQARLSALGMFFKPFAGGAHIFISQQQQLVASEEKEPLRFELQCSDPLYMNYTELEEFNPLQEALFFDNLGAVNEDGSLVYRLLNDSFQSAPKILRKQSGIIALATFEEDAFYTFSRGKGDVIPLDAIEQSDPTVNAFIFYDVPEGIVRVYKNDEFMDLFYYQPSGLLYKPLGMLALYPSILLNQYKEHMNTVTYAIDFKVRKTHWKYFIIQSRTPYLENLIIKQNEVEGNFQRLMAGEDTTVFISKKPIALSEKPKGSFQLMQKENPESEEDKTIISLPHASPQQLHTRDDASFKAYFSHQYIYI